jgi:catechol 2,3-dioxygenase-like lactoylglutathione lyase family enzyme
MKTFLKGAVVGAALALAGCATTPAGPSGAGAMALGHWMTAISVADLDKETTWFRDHLGFTVTADTRIGGGTPVRWLENGDERIELIAAAGSVAGPVRATPPRHAGIRGISQITLESRDLQATRDALVAKGITPALDITEVAPLGIKVIYLVDPEGNAIEIAQRTGTPTK